MPEFPEAEAPFEPNEVVVLELPNVVVLPNVVELELSNPVKDVSVSNTLNPEVSIGVESILPTLPPLLRVLINWLGSRAVKLGTEVVVEGTFPPMLRLLKIWSSLLPVFEVVVVVEVVLEELVSCKIRCPPPTLIWVWRVHSVRSAFNLYPLLQKLHVRVKIEEHTLQFATMHLGLHYPFSIR